MTYVKLNNNGSVTYLFNGQWIVDAFKVPDSHLVTTNRILRMKVVNHISGKCR